MIPKPSACSDCVLEKIGLGYAPADGPSNAEILFVGESLGFTEAQTGRPFTGDAGGMLQRILTLLGLQRSSIRIDNCVRCRPPQDWLAGAPWEYSATKHCAPYLEDSLSQPSLKVVVPMGASAIKRILQVSGKKIGPENFHGTINQDVYGRFLVVPTYHPSHLQRGAHNLIGTVLWDLTQALRAKREGKPTDEGTLVVDPPIDWFRAWIDQFLEVAREDPDSYPLSVDVETPDKAHGKDEGEITAEDRSFIITRVNLACHPDEGITVPFVMPYTEELLRLFSACLFPLWMFNKEYDIPRLTAANVLPSPTADKRTLDLMWLWHYLQSDLPRGLGFVAPFYSTYGPWKHLSDKEPEKYGAIDGLQNHRVGFGVLQDLQKLGMLEGALRHIHLLHHQILKPAQKVGVKIDRQRLTIFKEDLTKKAADRLDRLQEVFPEALRPLTPKAGLTKKPAADLLHVKATAFTRKGKKRAGKETTEIKLDLYKKAVIIEKAIERDVLVCQTCGAVEIQRRHRCPALPRAQAHGDAVRPDPVVSLETRVVARWFWQEPFNPDSPVQVLDYIKFRKHAPGKAKKTHKDSTDRETLERLQKTGDPFYRLLLDYRAIVKVKGTYVEGTEQRLDAEDRVHPEPTYKPSTHRLCIAAGTPVEIARDVAQYPRGIPIEDVQPGMWAYTFDDQRRLTLRRVVSVLKTGMKPILRLHWVSGFSGGKPRFGFLDLTPEHEVRLVDGTYRRADLLRQGDRVLAMTRGFTAYGYQRLWATGHRQINEHRFVYHETGGASDAEHVHHLNHQKLDNRPENLRGGTASDHLKYHGQFLPSEQTREIRRQTMKRLHKQGRFKGPRRPRLNLTPEWLREALALADGRPTYVAERHGIDYETLMKYIDQHGIVCRRKPRRSPLRNHMIVFVEPRPVIAPVYDLEIDETHNFIANEICVHNSYVNPNITNVIQDRGGQESLAAGFRRCVVASPGCRLLEVDYAGSEAVDVGWLCRDPKYIRLAKLGVHAGLASHILGRPYDPAASDVDLGAYFKAIKKSPDEAVQAVYNRSKRFVHGSSYGLTIPGMVLQFPETFPTRKIAEHYDEIFKQMAPAVPKWQRQTRELAFKQHYLGGPGAHPFGYKHWFWSVYTFKKITLTQYLRIIREAKKKGIAEGDAPATIINGQYFKIALGEDGKRAIAFMPQSITAGKLKETMLILFDPDSPHYIGDAYFGRTPLRAPIHDSLLLEVPKLQWDRVCEAVFTVMSRPVPQMPIPESWGMGTMLATGISAKAGFDWQQMEDLETTVIGVGTDTVTTAAQEEEVEEVSDLGREVA